MPLGDTPTRRNLEAITMHQMKVLTPTTVTTEEGTAPRVPWIPCGSGFFHGGVMLCRYLPVISTQKRSFLDFLRILCRTVLAGLVG